MGSLPLFEACIRSAPPRELQKNRPYRSMICFKWQPEKDSNPHKQSQSLSCYLYTIRLFVHLLSALLLTKIIISNPAGNVNT